MCEALLEMQRKSEAKGLEKGLEKGREEGREEGREQMLLENIASVMAEFGVSPARAMEVLRVPEAERPRFLAML